MKILLATNYMPPHLGGIEYAAQSLKKCWENKGHQVTWIASDIAQNSTDKSPDIIQVPSLNFMENLFEINTPCFNPSVVFKLKKLVETHDIVNTHSLAPSLSLAVLEAALRYKRPVVVTQHVGVITLKSGIANLAQQKLIPALAKRALDKGALMTFVSPVVRDWFIEKTGCPENRFKITPAGIDSENFTFVTDAEKKIFRKKWGLNDKQNGVLFVGRFVEKKGINIIKETATRCSDTVFTLLGSGPVKIKNHQPPNVRVLEHVSTDELRELYGAHDLFIMPSFGEGWPAVVPQAMACGLPCLISQDAFQGHGTDEEFFIVRNRNADEFTKVLTDAATGQIPLTKSRRDISVYAHKTWSWQRTAETYISLFNTQISKQINPD